MGLMEDLGAWLDQKKRNVASSVQNPGLLYTRMNEDARQFQQDQRDNWGDVKSVVPEVKAAGLDEFSRSGQELGAMAPAGLLGWTAWHGSPHKFDKFDLSKIGTGEGAQAYGHGLYFADAQGVAKQYAQNLGPDAAINNIDAFLRQHYGIKRTEQEVADRLRKFPGLEGLADNTKAVTAIKDLLPDYRPNLAIVNSKDLNNYRALNAEVEKSAPQNVYKVDISDVKAPQDAFLQWDKPLSEQPKRVQDAVQTLTTRATDEAANPNAMHGMATWSDRTARRVSPDAVGSMDGAAVHEMLQKVYGNTVSDELKRLGIPGIRYLDGGSRGFKVKLETSKGPYADSMFPTKQQAEQYAAAKAQEGFKTSIVQDGTMNTVLFDDSLVKILERNGQPLGLLGR
jgi:hypothetical protein